MSLVGADIAAIRNFVLGLNRRSKEITNITARLTALIDDIPWAGPDRDAFIQEWHHTHRPGLLGLIDDLLDAGRQATRHADAQEAASAAKGDGA